jgi:hypothetical protein
MCAKTVNDFNPLKSLQTEVDWTEYALLEAAVRLTFLSASMHTQAYSSLGFDYPTHVAPADYLGKQFCYLIYVERVFHINPLVAMGSQNNHYY